MAASTSTRASRVTARTSTSIVHRSATTFGRVPPLTTPTLTVTPGHRPLSAWSSVTMRAASRMALRPFSGSTPAWAARPLTVISKPEIALARRHDVAVGARALEDEAGIRVDREPTDVRGRRGRADLLVGVGDEDQAREREPAEHLAHGRDPVQAGQQPALHVGDAGAARDAVRDRERAGRRGARVEHRVHVADAQERRPVGVAARDVGDRPCRRGRARWAPSSPTRRGFAGVPRSSGRPRPRPPWCSSRSRCSRGARDRRGTRAARGRRRRVRAASSSGATRGIDGDVMPEVYRRGAGIASNWTGTGPELTRTHRRSRILAGPCA